MDLEPKGKCGVRTFRSENEVPGDSRVRSERRGYGANWGELGQRVVLRGLGARTRSDGQLSLLVLQS